MLRYLRLIRAFILFIFVCWMLPVTAHQSDSVIFENDHIKVTLHETTNTYALKYKDRKQGPDSLKFARKINQYFQVLSTANELYYVGLDGIDKKEVKDYFWVCGTVPHYKLSITKNTTGFYVYEHETHYTDNDTGRVLYKINPDEADSLVFISGRTEFMFTSNFNINIGAANPRQVILIKDGKYFTKEHASLLLDSISFTDYREPILTQKDDLWGVLDVIAPKYQYIESFNYYLAKATKPNGEEVFIDIDGNEY